MTFPRARLVLDPRRARAVVVVGVHDRADEIGVENDQRPAPLPCRRAAASSAAIWPWAMGSTSEASTVAAFAAEYPRAYSGAHAVS